jgi:nitrite reductase (NAD(P)H)
MADVEPEPIVTPGLEPSSGGTHSPLTQSPVGGTKGLNTSNSEWNDPEANKLPEKVEKLSLNGELPPSDEKRKRVVIVGLGMVGISFMYVAFP